MERLQKLIAEAGYCSRRKAEELIKQGKVLLNGEKVTQLGTKASFGDEILVEGNLLEHQEKKYYLFYKPRGVVCTTKDDKGRKTVLDFFDDEEARIYPVGRLDYDTTGLIILTNDGNLANTLMHPTNAVPKKYIAKLNKCMAITDYKRLKEGIEIDGIKCVPIRVKIKKNDTEKDYSIIEITIVEGRNHIIKRVFNKLGYLVDKLSRVEYAFLNTDNLKSGDYRKLTPKEVKKLYEYHS